MYTLLRAVLTVKRVHEAPHYLKLFEDISQKNKLIRAVYYVFKKTACTFIAAFMLLCYGLVCYIRIKPLSQQSADILCLASFPNEHKSINFIKKKLLDTQTLDLNISRKNIFDPKNWVEAFNYILMTPRLYKFARRCSSTLQFMPACVVFSTVVFYARYKRILSHNNLKGILVAHNHSAECTALSAAAHMNSLKFIFINHAYVADNSAYTAPLLSDLAILTNQAAVVSYSRKSKQVIRHVLIGYEQTEKPLKLNFAPKPNEIIVGIFLTCLTQKNNLRALIETLQKILPPIRIIIRSHPVALVNENFEDILHSYSFVELSHNSTLDSDIKRCDLAVCGNTSAAIEILKGGCPVIYDGKLDSISYDFNRFIEEGLIIPIEKINEQPFERITEFYTRAEWVKIMQFYDASYQHDATELFRHVEKELKSVLDE